MHRNVWLALWWATLILVVTPLVGWAVFPAARHLDRSGWLYVLCIVLVLVVAPPLGSLILGPVNRMAGRLPAPTRFLLPDFMWLVVQLQLALGYCVSFVGVEQRYFFPLMLGFLSLASLLMWAGAVSFLSRAGVRSNLRRGIFILVLLPATLALMIVSPILPVLCYLLQTNARGIEDLFQIRGYLPPNAGLLLLAASILFLPALGLGLNRLSRWMVAGLQPVASLKPAAAS